eukprot:3456814-Pyramimonas_sp.AAC.1
MEGKGVEEGEQQEDIVDQGDVVYIRATLYPGGPRWLYRRSRVPERRVRCCCALAKYRNRIIVGPPSQEGHRRRRVVADVSHSGFGPR